MASPRPYVAAAAASVLAALYFVPSASASPQHAPATSAHAAPASAQHLDLADTGSIDTKPYVIGGSAFLVAGAALVVDATRRARRAAL
ncbi:hypothetical protein JT723_11235 [Streptomyces bryophytorum]|nr:hypothetical protein [Actinacidiphila bryophytorum]MBN6546352.1 hypothetical protein [Actinacidiphila bryophytorum]